jgi:hypothetical protein
MKLSYTVLPALALATLGFGFGMGYSAPSEASCQSYCYSEFYACRNAANNLADVRECVIERNACLASCG